jgi:SAM-dependent methyltransferase
MSDNWQPSDLSRTDVAGLDVVERYRRFAPVYDQSVADWGYRCWHRAALAIAERVAVYSPLLDAGCGTGLVGKALAKHGFTDLTGIDISPDMIVQAARLSCYRRLFEHDLGRTPYPFADGAFAAVACIGVLSLIADAVPVLAELRRLTAPGGWLVFTQQESLFEQRGYAELLAGFEARGELRRERVDAPRVYLPHREGFGDRRVIQCVYQVNVP